ncbi:HAMP domain-containing sensor histidine kinase [Paracoccus thiocyanatus]|nr:ATP-binding protein [Paracoccus thiocyanatus]
MMRGRLFLKIYLTVLGGIAILALAGVATVLALVAREDRGWLNQRATVLAAALAGARDAQAVLNRIGPAIHSDIELRDAAGRIIARHGDPGDGGRAVSVAMPDGGSMTMRFDPPFRRHGIPLVVLALVAGLTAVAAWPVVRHLTGRLERLRRGVETWGQGDLALRVPVEGRDEIAAVAASFNGAAAQVEALVNGNRALLANASHELRSPLARLRMAVDLHDSDPSDARRQEIARNLAELDELVGEILLSSRLTHAGIAEPLQRLDLLALAAEEAALAGLEVRGHSAEVTGDARLLARLIRNLIQNGLRHGRPPLDITVGASGAQAWLSVRDHGPGVPLRDGERVFEPFYRPGGHGEAAGGWGLGLALVRQIAEGHGGSVRLDAPPDGGAAFTVTLPLAPKAH